MGRTENRYIVMVSPQFGSRGGAEVQAGRVAAELVRRGHRVVVLAQSGFGDRANEVKDGVTVVRFPRPFRMKGLRKFDTALFIGLGFCWLLAQRSRPNVVHAHIVSPQAIAVALAAQSRSIPAIVKVSSSGSNADFLRYLDTTRGRRRLNRAFDRLVVTSEIARIQLLEGGLVETKVESIPNGIPPVSSVRDATASTLTVVCVASLRPVKAHEVLLKAWARSGDGMCARLLIVGDGPRRAELETMVAALSIERTVEFLGQSDDVNAVLRLADVFALTSKAEGMSNAVLEAMAAGLPCVLTDVGANATCVGEAGSDFVVSPGDVDETVRALTSLLEDANLRASVGSAMLERVRSYYSIESVCDRYEELYARLADEREVGRS